MDGECQFLLLRRIGKSMDSRDGAAAKPTMQTSIVDMNDGRWNNQELCLVTKREQRL